MEAFWVVEISKFAIERFSQPVIINTDQGGQFTSYDCVAFLEAWVIQIPMDGKGRDIDNVNVERFLRTIKYDNIYFESIETGPDVQRACHECIQYYNNWCHHSSIGYQRLIIYHKLAA